MESENEKFARALLDEARRKELANFVRCRWCKTPMPFGEKCPNPNCPGEKSG